jgi:tRNA(fMet)-specific endonuclease VapC
MQMNGKHLLDTNIVVALFKNDDNVRNQIAASAEVFVPAIAVGELYYGAQHSAHVEKNMKLVREFAANSTVLACDIGTAEHYGPIKNELKTKGHPLPENDVWIAAIAKQHSLTVVTRDQQFKEIDGLLLEEW